MTAGPVSPRQPAQPLLYRVVQGHLATVRASHDGAHRIIPVHAEPARHRDLEARTYLHLCTIDGVFEPEDRGMGTRTAGAPAADEVEAVQAAAAGR